MAKTKKSILELYMQWVLEHGSEPESVYKFCKENKLTETEFYQEYGSLKAVEKKVFTTFFEKTIELLEKNEEYQQYDSREKLLSFYYTFFEILTANRSYVLAALPKNIKEFNKLEQLKGLREHFSNYTQEIFAEQIKSEAKRLEKFKSNTFQEAAWAQLLVVMRFWVNDESAGFEKTDIFIEKAIMATFDLVENTPIKSVLDLGKFLYKEAIA
ncbi:TetR family transcriptional regulator C-terminal domain-containing protein [Jiulongibacter sediminis]|uniref:Heat-shock protein n=1 Tax=Jiulongibacter sediminis TaxID=1605367 RepID=A0A0P7BQC4_9BACT|nr:TetR family transcriptional regulator C-terminal domain-containing protein [Jiulongibacter sediminis]KPM49349.1 heat-shock protein [Jiulongibacter sediminis]TBX26400.1 heat-shock protein [Jiulongibacter sediminis]